MMKRARASAPRLRVPASAKRYVSAVLRWLAGSMAAFAVMIGTPAAAQSVCTQPGVTCIPAGYTPWNYASSWYAGDGPYGTFSSAADAYNALITWLRQGRVAIFVSASGLSEFTSNPALLPDFRQGATFDVSWYDYSGAPLSNAPAYVQRWRYISCPLGYRSEEHPNGGSVCWTNKPSIPLAIDPGHGFTCPSKGMQLGAVGVTAFPTSNPPAGRLQEDDLTMKIALEVKRQMPSANYRVVLTKQSANACPTFLDRGRIANNANAKVFVSIHINAPNFYLGVNNPIGNGTSVLYNVNKSGSFNLADDMARNVSTNLGVNNRGAQVDSEIAVLKPTVTRTNAVLLETARLSGRDEELLHAPDAPARVAAGVRAAIESFLPN